MSLYYGRLGNSVRRSTASIQFIGSGFSVEGLLLQQHKSGKNFRSSCLIYRIYVDNILSVVSKKFSVYFSKMVADKQYRKRHY
jgi:hypothetical protein